MSRKISKTAEELREYLKKYRRQYYLEHTKKFHTLGDSKTGRPKIYTDLTPDEMRKKRNETARKHYRNRKAGLSRVNNIFTSEEKKIELEKINRDIKKNVYKNSSRKTANVKKEEIFNKSLLFFKFVFI